MKAAGVREVRSDVVDVASRTALETWAGDVVGQLGRVNVLVNNAGVSLTGEVADLDVDDMEWIVDINFWGVVHGTRAFLPHLIASGEGHVVTMSSLFGLVSIPGQSLYNATKYAVRGFSESLREEMLDRRPSGRGHRRPSRRHQDRDRAERAVLVARGPGRGRPDVRRAAGHDAARARRRDRPARGAARASRASSSASTPTCSTSSRGSSAPATRTSWPAGPRGCGLRGEPGSRGHRPRPDDQVGRPPALAVRQRLPRRRRARHLAGLPARDPDDPAGRRVRLADRPARPGATGRAPPDAERGWLATFHGPGGPLSVYVDVTAPPTWSGATVTAIDLDLDVVRELDGRVWVDDEDEFAEHQVFYVLPARGRRGRPRLLRPPGRARRRRPPAVRRLGRPWFDPRAPPIRAASGSSSEHTLTNRVTSRAPVTWVVS